VLPHWPFEVSAVLLTVRWSISFGHMSASCRGSARVLWWARENSLLLAPFLSLMVSLGFLPPSPADRRVLWDGGIGWCATTGLPRRRPPGLLLPPSPRLRRTQRN